MNVFAIGDLHLPGGQQKPMEVFGAHWQDHFDTIGENWRNTVTERDIVLLPGDISWAMTLSQAGQDLYDIGALPGRKIMIKGNHEYWWSSITQVRALLPPGFFALQNDALLLDELLFAGTRGWPCPGGREFGEHDQKLYTREVQRMEMSLSDARKKSADAPLIAMIHYPPFNERQDDSGFTQLFERYDVRAVLYGHLHGRSIDFAFNGHRRGILYRLTSCDALDFKPLRLDMEEIMRLPGEA